MPIVRLEEHLINKIAAGEVIERPASVLKELLENSIDAKSSRIQIQLEQSGLALIQVSDNGQGISRSDLPLAFERHATSKITNERELFRIRTLGFRGEALPSIASVAKVKVVTRTEHEAEGSLIELEGGEAREILPAACNVGTTFSVSDLFYNTPVRLKYVKSLQTELGHCLDIVQKLALAHPNLAFSFLHNGKLVFQTAGNGDLLQTYAALYGKDIAKQMLRVNHTVRDHTVQGLIGVPALSRANRNHCLLFLNGRPIRHFGILNGVIEAFGHRLPIHRFPIFALQLTIDPSLVDVNVHPTKLEVRFSEEEDVRFAVRQAVELALSNEKLIPVFGSDSSTVPSRLFMKMNSSASNNPFSVQTNANEQNKLQTQQQSFREFDYRKPVSSKPNLEKKQVDSAVYEQAMQLYEPQTEFSNREQAESPISQETVSSRSRHSESANMQIGSQIQAGLHRGEIDDSSNLSDSPDITASTEDRLLLKLKPVAQTLGMYVLAENPDGLYIIDQHAAHERILFERFRRNYKKRSVSMMPLLIPITRDLTPNEKTVFEQLKPQLESFCFEMEWFGESSILIRSVPDIWAGQKPDTLTIEFLDECFQDSSSIPKLLDKLEETIIMKACKAAIKANQWLSMPEMTALCQGLDELEDPFHCPHGRPILLHFSHYELEKQFKRVM